MRFGVMTIQLTEMMSPSAETGHISGNLGAFDHANMVYKLWSLGFNPIELSGDLGMFLPQAFDAQAVEKMAALKEEYNIGYTVHLPLWSVETSTPLEPVRQGSVKAVADSILATKALEPEVYVLHATGALAAEFYRMELPELMHNYLLQQFQQGALESVKYLLEITGIPSRKLAVETIEFPFDLTLVLAEILDLSICLDVGHIMSGFSGPLNLYKVLDLCLPRLAEVHLHDAVNALDQNRVIYGQDHQPLGSCDLDTARFLDVLHTFHYDGPIILELPVKEAIASLDLIRELRPQYIK